MHVGEALVLSASERPDGTQEVRLKAVCPEANLDRLNVVLGTSRVAVLLNRPERGSSREFDIAMRADSPIRLGDKVLVEFYYPGEQAGSH